MPACPVIHVAFYLWYATPAHDGRWSHWDHATLPHWTAAMNERFPPGQPFTPPDQPHSPFYPARGLYSSGDAAVLREQMSELAAAGVDTVMLSWWGQAGHDIRRDSQGVSTDELVPTVLDAAAAAGIGVTWHLEPYGGRTPRTVLDDLKYLHAQYGAHPAIWRQPHGVDGRLLPVVFLYDVSAEHSGAAAHEWRDLTREIRGTAADAVLLSLYLDERDQQFVAEAELDGAYTYFAATGFTRGSTPHYWRGASEAMVAKGKMFVPSVGPGYNDTLIRPWNYAQTHPRDGGHYYDQMWKAAIQQAPPAITITSYNEWGEGTQIEGARPHTTATGAVYADYGVAQGPAFYLERTRAWAAAARPDGCVRLRSGGGARGHAVRAAPGLGPAPGPGPVRSPSTGAADEL